MVIKITRHVALFAVTGITLFILMTGCTWVVHRHPVEPRAVYVKTPPPPVRVETKTEPPSSVHVWVEGYWDYNTSQEEWAWQEGTWTLPPEESTEWEEPRYEDRGEGSWVYVPGRWGHPKHRGSHRRTESKADKQKVSVAKPAEIHPPHEDTSPAEETGHIGIPPGDGTHPHGKKTHYDDRDKNRPDGKEYQPEDKDNDKYVPPGKKYGNVKYPQGKKTGPKDRDKGKYVPPGKKYGDVKYPQGKKTGPKDKDKGKYVPVDKKYGNIKYPQGKKKETAGKDKPVYDKPKASKKDKKKPVHDKPEPSKKDKTAKKGADESKKNTKIKPNTSGIKKIKKVDTRVKPSKVKAPGPGPISR